MRGLVSILFSIFTGVTIAQCDSVPVLNQKIVDLADAKLKKKVGRGECWDLAQYVLNETGAKWDGEYVYGRLLTKSECLNPGDIIQFEKIVVEYKVGKQTFKETMPHHTAIIHKVFDQDHVELIHQNTGYTGRKVGVSELRFSTITKGKYLIYRPEY